MHRDIIASGAGGIGRCSFCCMSACSASRFRSSSPALVGVNSSSCGLKSGEDLSFLDSIQEPTFKLAPQCACNRQNCSNGLIFSSSNHQRIFLNRTSGSLILAEMRMVCSKALAVFGVAQIFSATSQNLPKTGTWDSSHARTTSKRVYRERLVKPMARRSPTLDEVREACAQQILETAEEIRRMPHF